MADITYPSSIRSSFDSLLSNGIQGLIADDALLCYILNATTTSTTNGNNTNNNNDNNNNNNNDNAGAVAAVTRTVTKSAKK